MSLTVATFVQLAAACGPAVHVETLASVARAESGFNPLVIHDNTTGRTYQPASAGDATRLAAGLIAQRHSVDLGLMQVNSANLAGLGLSIADSFDPCQNIRAGARVLVAAYKAPGGGADVQPALLQAFSRYNTGRPDRGFTNGYIRRVQFAASQIVPAIRLAGSARLGETGGDDPPASPTAPPPPPAWDVYARARYARDNAGAVSAAATPPSTPASTPVIATADAPPPVQLQAIVSPKDDNR